MVELLVDCRLPSTQIVKRSGEVIVARIAGSPWGNQEYLVFLIVRRSDPALEARLQALVDATTPFPSIDYPYEVLDAAGNQLTVSSITIDRVNPLVSAIPGINDTVTPILPVNLPEQVWLRTVSVPSPDAATDSPASLIGKIGNGLMAAWNWLVGTGG